jgi:hypothetical protein
MTLLGVILILFGSFGCASRTKIGLGPVQVAAQTEAFKEIQTPAFDFSLSRVGFTLGHIRWFVESKVGPCEEVISVQSSTGNADQVFEDVPAL